MPSRQLQQWLAVVMVVVCLLVRTLLVVVCSSRHLGYHRGPVHHGQWEMRQSTHRVPTWSHGLPAPGLILSAAAASLLGHKRCQCEEPWVHSLELAHRTRSTRSPLALPTPLIQVLRGTQTHRVSATPCAQACFFLPAWPLAMLLQTFVRCAELGATRAWAVLNDALCHCCCCCCLGH